MPISDLIIPASMQECSELHMTCVSISMLSLSSRCADYVEVDRGIYGRTESCGTEVGMNTNQLEGRM